MGQSAQEAHMFFVHKIHRKIYPVEGSRENASSPTVDIGNMWKNVGDGFPVPAVECNSQRIALAHS